MLRFDACCTWTETGQNHPLNRAKHPIVAKRGQVQESQDALSAIAEVTR